MARLMSNCWNLLTVVAIVIALTGCETPKPKEEKSKSPKTVMAKVPMGSSYAWKGFPQPAPTPQDSKILVEKIVPKKVNPNETFEFKLIVTNNASFKIDKIVLTENIPDGFKLSKSSLTPVSKGGKFQWNLGTMLPKQKKMILVSGKPTKVGTIRYTGETLLSFDVKKATSCVNVIRPDLRLSLTAPKVVIIGEKIPIELKLKNTGQAMVLGTKLVHTLPKGLLTFEGKSKIELNIGDLKPNQIKSFPLVLKGEKTGIYNTTFEAVAEEGITSKASMSTKITKPTLTIAANAPKKRFVGNFTPYNITVKNNGDAIAKNAIVKLALPESTTLVSANEYGKKVGKNVIWEIPKIFPGETKKLSAKVIVKKIMTARAVASAQAFAADKVEAVTITDVAGLAGLLCELIDENDPVPLDEEVIYVLKVTNQGSLDATKIKVTCFLEDSMEFVKTSGASKSIIKGNKLTFEPLPALSPQSFATWKIRIKAKKDGDVRFKVHVESDQLTRPVELDEATHFYE